MKIKVNFPIIEMIDNKKIIHIKIESELGSHSYLSIDFSELISFASHANANVFDFFVISSCVYGIDRFITRKNHSIDGWSREINVDFPVIELSQWNNAQADLESVLSFLTGDHWRVKFHKSNLKIPKCDLSSNFHQDFSLVSLFSGGLDSLIGIIDYLEKNPEKRIILSSHYDPEMPGPKGDQNELRSKLIEKYGKQIEYIPSVKISLPYSSITKETTFRSRSIIFIGIALLAAHVKGTPILIPENGTVSLNYPLSPSRRSACSTRTTHPTYLKKLRQLWDKLGIQTVIFNPYEFSTKGEMVRNCLNSAFLKQIIHESNSCGKMGHRTNWDTRSASHCGICLPCTYRRAALLFSNDVTGYGNDINKRFSGRNFRPFLISQQGQDISALLEYVRKPMTMQDVKTELLIGGLGNLDSIQRYAEVVLRAKEELRLYIESYGNSVIKQKAGIK